MKFFDDKSKNLKWWNKNYFYAGTLFIIFINIMLFAVLGEYWTQNILIDSSALSEEHFYFLPTIRAFLSAFDHHSWIHVIGNMLCFSLVGLYLERKKGTFALLGYVFLAAYLAGCAKITNRLSLNSAGFSFVNYFFYGMIFIDYILSLKNDRKNVANTIIGASIFPFIYFTMCNYNFYYFKWYPCDLFNNAAHYSGIVMGIVITIFIEIVIFTTRKLISEEKQQE